MDYQKIVEYLRNTHDDFIEKYKGHIEKNATEHHILREMAYAKLTLLGKAFLSANVITKYEEVTISNSDRNLSFYTPYGGVFYFLNGTNVVAFVPGQLSLIDAANNIDLLSYASEEDRVVMRDIHSENFDWFEATKKILDIIHKTAYRKTEALNDYIHQLFVQSNGGQ